MSILKVQLARDLRRSILRGHPWVYREALKAPPQSDQIELCQILDSKGASLAWGIYHPQGPLALRILSTDKKPPGIKLTQDRLGKALRWRQRVIPPETNAFRWVNGEGDGLPGLVSDIYDSVAVIQTDGPDLSYFWPLKEIGTWLLANSSIESVVEKSRGSETTPKYKNICGTSAPSQIEIQEQGARFLIDLERGQKTGFFLDQRENRCYLRNVSRNKNLLNLFSYTGGFSVNGGLGRADHVTSLDISPSALELAEQNWLRNDLKPSSHETISQDASQFLQQSQDKWSAIAVDPPSMARSEKEKPQATKKYLELFSGAARRVSPQGDLFLSSCSSHISFFDFEEIVTGALSQARRKAQIVRFCGQGPDHPYPHACPELRYLKFIHLILD